MSRPYKVELTVTEVRNIYIDSAESLQDAEDQAVSALENAEYDAAPGEVEERDISYVTATPADEM